MKKIFLALVCSISTMTVMAETSDTLLLHATVEGLLSISVNASGIASNLPLETTQLNTKVAMVHEKSNSNTGYKVSISSTNKGKLVRTNGEEQFPYVLIYDSQNLDLTSNAPVVISHEAAQAV